jgi:hypothetical protein
MAYSWFSSAFHAITSEDVLQKLLELSDAPAMFSPILLSFWGDDSSTKLVASC